MNPMDLLKIQGAWMKFTMNHPKFPAFISAVAKCGLPEGSLIEIAITPPEGVKLETNLMVQQSDLELLGIIRGMAAGRQADKKKDKAEEGEAAEEENMPEEDNAESAGDIEEGTEE